MSDPSALNDLIETIKAAVAPVFLLTGIAALMAVLMARLARIIDRARELGERITSDLSNDQRAEARLIKRRIGLLNLSILLAAISALAVCSLIALLFVASLIDFNFVVAVELTFVASMILLIGAIIVLIVEFRTALPLSYLSEDRMRKLG